MSFEAHGDHPETSVPVSFASDVLVGKGRWKRVRQKGTSEVRPLKGDGPAFAAATIVVGILVWQALAHGETECLGYVLWGYVLAMGGVLGIVTAVTSVGSKAGGESFLGKVGAWLQRGRRRHTDGWGEPVEVCLSREACRVGTGEPFSWDRFDRGKVVERADGTGVLLRQAGGQRREWSYFVVGSLVLTPILVGAALQFRGAWLGFQSFGGRLDVLAAATAGLYNVGLCLLVLYYLNRWSLSRKHVNILEITFGDAVGSREAATALVQRLQPKPARATQEKSAPDPG